jgi:Fe2+ or Zn2+ uptake regulation protein
LICDTCGSIDDFEVGPSTEHELERVLQSAAKSARFVVTGHRLDAIGVCANCQKNSARAAH